MREFALGAAARPVDWGGVALLALLTAAAGAYAIFVLGRRARLVMRAGRAGAERQWGPLLGLLCGVVGVALVALDLATGWLAEARSTGINWHAHQWAALPIIACGFIVTWSEPGRPRSLFDSKLAANARAHPRQVLAGVLVGATSWAILPLIARLPAPVRGYVVFMWPALLLAEIAAGIWWSWRHGRIEELTDGQRTVFLPSYMTHPVLWGWLMGMLTLVLGWAMLDQLRMGF